MEVGGTRVSSCHWRSQLKRGSFMSATANAPAFTSVYGPVSSWRYGRSLGIDPIGSTSACSFNCVYCQLGEIEIKTSDRQIFVPTDRILQDLQPFAPWDDIDVITLSGSGEPTLALNLHDIITGVKAMTGKPVAVLTNATLLSDPDVREALSHADIVAAKLDATSPETLQAIDRPTPDINWAQLWAGLQQFSATYPGRLDIQTMMMSPWKSNTQQAYIDLIKTLQPHEIQLNTPTRPKPLKHEFDARGNHSSADDRPYRVRTFKQLSPERLQQFARDIQSATGIPVRCAPSKSKSLKTQN